jgi:hypothetical protein
MKAGSVPDGSSKAISFQSSGGPESAEDLAVLRAIVAREHAMDQLLDMCCTFDESESSEASELPGVSEDLLEQLLLMRTLSIDVIERIAGWRRRMVQHLPFIWRRSNYLLKMTSDLDFVSKSRIATSALGGTRMVRRNPFVTIGGLDHSMRAVWAFELPEPDDIPVLLDAAAFGGSARVLDQPTRLRLCERLLLYEEQRFGRLPASAVSSDPRFTSLVKREAEFAAKSRFGAVGKAQHAASE